MSDEEMSTDTLSNEMSEDIHSDDQERQYDSKSEESNQ